jgi:spermidine/putrescine-binding protein
VKHPPPFFARAWHTANRDTLLNPPIKEWARFYLTRSTVSVDPFARNSSLANWTNDLNPETAANFHMDAFDFLLHLKKEGVTCDLCIFDPPYSRAQVKECYEGVGRHFGQADSQGFTGNWKKERDALDSILAPGGVVLSFGWNSSGMTLARGYTLESVLLVCHGGAHHDTICIAERKQS